MQPLTYANGLQANYIDALYEEYKKSPDNINPSWRNFFEGFDLAYQYKGSSSRAGVPELNKEASVITLIEYYRTNGHRFAQTNPIENIDATVQPEHNIKLEKFDLSEKGLQSHFVAGKLLGLGSTTLKEIINFLRRTYCSTIGYEYMHLQEESEISWLQHKIETHGQQKINKVNSIDTLKNLHKAALFEDFLHTKFVGKKRFSLEGGEALIASLYTIAQNSPHQDVKSIIIGMAHRGRINTLVNILGKPYADVFAEFDGKGIDPNDQYGGDTSYHMGFEKSMNTSDGKEVNIVLCPNPSHLETVNSIVEGLSRALIDNKYKKNYNNLVPLLIHGDAAVSAQGIVYEVTQMANLAGYKTGGTIHIIINNFIGFTTSADQQKSSLYCSDIAQIIKSPVLHVNGMDAEAVVFASNLCLEYRQKFNKDIWIDLRCYRKYGHNEGDEPAFTQPALYKEIKEISSVNKRYAKSLIEAGILTPEEDKKIIKEIKEVFQKDFEKSKAESFIYEFKNAEFNPQWQKISPLALDRPPSIPKTSVKADTLIALANKVFDLPVEKKFVSKVSKLFADRQVMATQNNKFDWGMGEYLAYASLLNEGVSIRLSGEDVGRGTFSHRHAILQTEDSKEVFIPLSRSYENNAKFHVYNSLLSEYGVLGYEYGYALAEPNMLTIWEAQFGDFANGAQIVIDQYVSSAFQKWRLHNGLVMLLPHGYEGQGPEHSSARVERYLELCANNNIFVTNLSTPAQLFHALRRQIRANYRIPLIIFTPKSLLRHPRCVSTIEDFSSKNFQEIIDDTKVSKDKVKKVLVCTGKIYYDLLSAREELKTEHVAIIRVEQLYPLDSAKLRALIKQYKGVKNWYFMQEEPENMGAWPFILQHFRKDPVEIISRPPASSPATGYMKNHIQQQKELVHKALTI